MSKNKYQGINPYVVNQVRYHARSLMRHPAIHGVEVEDLEQEMMLDYLSRSQAFDPEKAKWSTFIDRILNHKCASIIEAAKAQKRGSGIREYSLDAWLEDKDGEDDALPVPATENMTVRDLRIDLEDAIQQMPPHLGRLCQKIAGTAKPAEQRLTYAVPEPTQQSENNTRSSSEAVAQSNNGGQA